MSETSDERRFPRVNTSGLSYGIRFTVLEHEVQESRMVNLSASGCGLEVPMADAWSIDVGAGLEDVYIDHQDVPYVPLHGTVVRILGKIPGKVSGYCLVGIDFNLITPFIQDMIREHVDARLAETS
jgi:hypothetical protein